MALLDARILRAKECLYANLSDAQKKQFDKFGMIKVLGSDNIVYIVASEEAAELNGMARITRADTGRAYCADIPLITYEKVLAFKMLLETNPNTLTHLIDDIGDQIEDAMQGEGLRSSRGEPESGMPRNFPADPDAEGPSPFEEIEMLRYTTGPNALMEYSEGYTYESER